MKTVLLACIALLGCETTGGPSTGDGLLTHTLPHVAGDSGPVAPSFEGMWSVTRTLVANGCDVPVDTSLSATWIVVGTSGDFVVDVEGDTAWPILHSIENTATDGPAISLTGEILADGSRIGLDLWEGNPDSYSGTEAIIMGGGCVIRRKLTITRKV